MNDEHAIESPSSTPAKPGRRAWSVAILASTAVFLLGAIVGSVATSVVLRSTSPWRFDAPQFRADRVANRLARDLELSDAQSARVQEIFRAQHDRLAAIRAETQPRVREVLDETRALVMAELSPEQQAEWNDRYDRMRRRMRAPGWDRPGGRHERGINPARLIEKHDGDSDKHLSYEELSRAWERLTQERFDRLDSDGDGRLSEAELEPLNRAQSAPNDADDE